MTYRFDRSLFLENGPTSLAERDRRLRTAGDIFRLLHRPAPASSAAARDLKAAA